MGGNVPSKPPKDRPPPKPKKPRALEGHFAELQTFLMTDVKEMSDLGAGSYAVVKKIACKGETYAAKQLHATLFNFAGAEEREAMLTQFAKECRLLQRAAHPNIVQFVGLHMDKSSPLPYLVMEFMKTTLSAHLENHGKLKTPSVYNILSDVALGLQFLHKHIPSIIHRDLSANNILLSDKLQAKISDLGMAKIINHNPSQKSQLTLTKAPGTVCYMPPEALSESPEYDTSIDTYSFGVLMIHALCGVWPLPGPGSTVDPEDPDKLIAVTEFDRRIKFVKDIGLDHPLVPLIEKCLHNSPDYRPNAPKIAETVMTVMANEVKYRAHVAIDKYKPPTSYELDAHDGEKFIVYEYVMSDEDLVKVKSERNRRVGYIPREMIYQLQDLYVSTKLYNATCREELSFGTREFMHVLHKTDGWLRAHLIKTGKEGLVPSQCVIKFKPLEERDWFFHQLNDDDAIALLSKPLNDEGAFLVRRDSDMESNNMVLYVKNDNKVVQYKIIIQGSGSLFVELPIKEEENPYEHIFSSVEDLVYFYSEKEEDICTKLGRPCLYTSEWEIKADEVDLQACISASGKIEVWKGGCGTYPVAARKLRSISNPKEATIEEIEVLKRLDHPNILMFHGIVFEKESITIVTEDLGWVTIVEHLRERGTSHMPIKLSMIRQVLHGLNHLQQKSVIHLDIGARNVVLVETPSLHCKITNFRKASRIDTYFISTKTEDIAIKWSAPEVINGTSLHRNSDVWSFAIFMYEVFTSCQPPYPNMTDNETAAQIKGGYRMQCPTNCPSPIYDIMKECWNITPDARPSFKSLTQRMRLLAATLSVDGKPIPAPRRNMPQSTTPVPKATNIDTPQNYENTELTQKFPPTVEKSAQRSHPKQQSMKNVPLLPSLPPRTPLTRQGTQNNIMALMEMQINRKSIKLVAKIKASPWNEVWEGIWNDNTHVMVTVTNPEKHQRSEVIEQIELMKKFQNPNVIKLSGVCTTGNPIYILTDLINPGSLLHFLRENATTLQDDLLLQVGIQVARGMAYLHTHFVIHRDIRADNILIDENNECKITGFHLFKRVDETTHTFSGTANEKIPIKWAAPEALTDHVYSTRSDIWSFGVFLYEVVTRGRPPYPSITNKEVMDKVMGGYRMPCPDNCPGEVYEIMLKCWNEKPDSRPSSVVLPQMLRDLTQPEESDFIEEEEEGTYIDVFGNIVTESPKKEWTVEFSDLTLLEKLKQGESGDIWRGLLLKTTPVAIKRIEMKDDVDDKVEQLKKLRHPNLLELQGVCTTDKYVHIITKFMQHGVLFNFLQNNANSLPEGVLLNMSLQCSKGMAFLEAAGILHGNLSSHKVLVGEELVCKITGVCGTDLMRGQKFSIAPKWMAPESAINKVFVQQSDIWSFGILLYEIMTCGQDPYPGMSDEEVLDNTARGYRMPCPHNCKEDVYNIMLECWNEDPSKRPTFEVITDKLSNIEVYDDVFDENMLLENEKASEGNEINLQYKLAESTTGNIWRGTWKASEVAIKCLNKYTADDELQKFELMKTLTNPHILKVFGICSKNETVCVAMDLMSHGNFQDYIAWEGSSLSVEKQMKVAIQCASGMAYLDGKDIIHGNLTARMILMGERFSCKITGIAGKGVASEDPYSGKISFYIPYKWMPLETVLYDNFTKLSDIWSFGVLLYEIMSHGDVPYSGMTDVEVVNKIREGYRMPCPPDCQRDVHNIMVDCWHELPNQRPSFNNIERRLEDICAYDSMPAEEEWPWNIRYCDISRISKIDDSPSGEVWRGMLKGRTEIAIKCSTYYSRNTELSITEMMKPLKNPNILRILGICSKGETVWVCMEFMENRNLQGFMVREGRGLTMETLLHFATHCASGMMYLEEKDIIHGNLTARQILVGGDLTCKITGICGDGVAHEDPYEGALTFFLPMKWRAPETAIYNEFTAASDVWSFGIVLYEIFSYGEEPYSGMSNATALEEIQIGFRMQCPPNCPRQVGGVMLDCWNKDPSMRPRFDNVFLRLKNQQKYMYECMNQAPTIVKESWEVQRSDICLEQKLSEGKAGSIWKGMLHDTKPVAIQIVTDKDDEWIKSMTKLTHPNVLNIEAVCITSEETLIMTEFMKNDNLVNFLRGTGRSMNLHQLTHVAVQVSDGLMYLKKQGIVHKDMSARNVLVGEKITCKITGILADWTDVVDDPYYEDRVYTPPVKWAAPEAVLYGQFTFQSDVWSFGITLYEIITYGRFPYPGMTRHEVISKIQEGYRMLCPANCPQSLYDLMRKCWQENPSKRCSIEVVNTTLRDYYDQLSSVKDEWEIDLKDITSEQKVGESEFGEELWKGRFHNQSVLIKYHSPQKVQLVEFLHEAEMLKALVHPNIIKLRGLCSTGKTIFVVFDFMKYYNLLKYLHTADHSVNHTKVLEMSAQVATGMVYLQKQGIIHRNLSASSIMISDDMTCRIANFHQAFVQNQKTKDKNVVKVRWAPVEVLSANHYSMKSDVWAYGIFLYELAARGETPYPGMTDRDVCERVPNGYRMPSPPVCPIGLHSIMLQCWKENPHDRPTFIQLHKSIENLVSQNNKWETNESLITRKHKLGDGRFGEVWNGEWKGIQVAVKYMKPESGTNEHFLREAELMKTLEHPCVIKLHAMCTQTKRPFIVMEVLDHNLLKELRRKNNTLKLVELVPMAVQVTSAMIYLHEQSIIHRDLAARSILVGSGNICKVSDFSDAIVYGQPVIPAQRDKRVPIRWTAPESAVKKIFSLKSDVWSFGILLHEMMKSGELPYPDIKDNRSVVNQLQSGYRMPCPLNCPQNIYQVMWDCWNENPQSRPTFQTIHGTLQKIQDDMRWEIESSEINFVRLVGTGRFGKVWEGQLNELPVAVKYHKPETSIASEFLWEAELLKSLNHPHVIRLVGVNSKADKVFIVTEFMTNGTLLEYLKSFARNQTLRTLMSMAAQVADGMAYLQTQSIVHRDLAARSVLVGESNVCKVSDFSEALCTTRKDNPEYKERKYPKKWMAPEAAIKQEYSIHTDIWSFGILLYEIVTLGSTPYPGMTQDEVIQMITMGDRMPIPPGCPQDIYSVMTECWKENPLERPFFETVQLQVQRISQTCKNTPLVRARTITRRDVNVERERTFSLNDPKPCAEEDTWELDRSTVKLDTKYEEGRFGEVWKGYMKDGELVAIKIPKTDRTSASEFLHESEIMKTLQHPYVIRLKGVCTKGGPIYIITEFMMHGNMVKYLRGPGRRTAMPQLLSWACQICSGMTYLEQCNIIHRDVAARNMLVSEQLVCKVSDFGLAQKVSSGSYKESLRTQFPLKWMAPETISQRSFSVKSDVWAFGILLYEVLTRGALPYPGVQNKDVAGLLKEGYRMPCPRGSPKGIYDIMLMCWKENPEERPNFSTIQLTLTSIK